VKRWKTGPVDFVQFIRNGEIQTATKCPDD
jgi:hypothetical protein